MIPVFQTGLDDCFQAAIASILEIELEAIPWYSEEEMEGFYDSEGKPVALPKDHGFDHYLKRLNRQFFPEYNMAVMACMFPDSSYCPKGYCISSVVVQDGPMKGFHHALVVLDGEVIHDPKPNPMRSYNHENYYFIFYYVNPAYYVYMPALMMEPTGEQHEKAE